MAGLERPPNIVVVEFGKCFGWPVKLISAPIALAVQTAVRPVVGCLNEMEDCFYASEKSPVVARTCCEMPETLSLLPIIPSSQSVTVAGMENSLRTRWRRRTGT